MRERKAADSMEARVGIKVSQPSNVFSFHKHTQVLAIFRDGNNLNFSLHRWQWYGMVDYSVGL